MTLPVTSGQRNYTAQILVRDIPSEPGAKPTLVLKTPTLLFTPYQNFDNVELPQNLPFAIVLDGNPAIDAQCEAHTFRSEPDLPAKLPGVATIKYNFKPGWKFLRVVPREAKRVPLPDKPQALGMWIRSDGSGDALRMRFTDATGQTFQPDGGLLDWKGWKYVEFPLQGSIGGRWGGANDGVIHYPIHIDTMLLVDSPGGRGGSGKISIAGVTLVEKAE